MAVQKKSKTACKTRKFKGKKAYKAAKSKVDGYTATRYKRHH